MSELAERLSSMRQTTRAMAVSDMANIGKAKNTSFRTNWSKTFMEVLKGELSGAPILDKSKHIIGQPGLPAHPLAGCGMIDLQDRGMQQRPPGAARIRQRRTMQRPVVNALPAQ